MRRHRLLPVVLLAACQASVPPLTDGERAEIQADVRSALDTFVAGGNALDVDMVMSLAAPDIEVVDFAQHFRGTDAVRAGWSDLFDNFQSWEAAWDDLRIDVAGPDLALFTGQFTLSRRFHDGRLQESNPYIYFSGRFQLGANGWMLTFGHLSGSVRIVEGSGA